MTTKESMALIGLEGLLRESRGMVYDVKIKDVKAAYGRTRLLVTPIAGGGEAWVEEESFTLLHPLPEHGIDA